MVTTTLETLGDWESTTLHQDWGNGFKEVPAARFYLRLRASRDEEGEIVGGGIRAQGEVEAVITPLDEEGEPKPEARIAMLPGRIEMQLQTERVIVENLHPDSIWAATRVWINDQDRTGDIVDLLVEFDYPEDRRLASYAVFKKRLFGANEVRVREIVRGDAVVERKR